MKSVIFAIFAAVLAPAGVVNANSVAAKATLSTEVIGYRASLRGEVGGWLSSCRYTMPKPFGPFMKRVDWGDGTVSVPDDFNHVSCGNMARHLYDEPGEYEITVSRTAIGGANDELVITETIRTTAKILPEAATHMTDDGTVRIGGQIGEMLASCDYPRRGRDFQFVAVDWGDGDVASTCPDTLSHRYQKAGAYKIRIGITVPGAHDGPVLAEIALDVVIPE